MLKVRSIWSLVLLGLLSGKALGQASVARDVDPAERHARLAERVPAVGEALRTCEEGLWREIDWHDDAAVAIAEAQERGLPLLVFVYKTLEPASADADAVMCLGAKVTRGTALADPEIQKTITSSFVPLHVDIAAGIPDELASMNFVQRVHDRRGPDKAPGFSTSVVLSPDGRAVLATSLASQGAARADVPAASRLPNSADAYVAGYAAMLERASEAHAERVRAQGDGPAAVRAFDRAHRRELAGGVRSAPGESRRSRG